MAVLQVVYWMSSIGLEFGQMNNPYVTKQDRDMKNKGKQGSQENEKYEEGGKVALAGC